MGGQARTNVVITAETKGFDKALRKTLGMNQKTLEGLKKQASAYSSVQKEIDGLDGKLSGLNKQQLELARSMEKVGDKSSESYTKFADKLKIVKTEAQDVARVMGNLAKVHRLDAQATSQLAKAQEQVVRQQERTKQASRGAFGQGLVQGLPGTVPFLQRGPGMMQQAAGMRVGQAIGGAMSTPFSGMQGLQQMVGAIPLGGQAMSGMLGQAAGYSGQALQYQQSRLAMTPYGLNSSSPALQAAQGKLSAFDAEAKYRRKGQGKAALSARARKSLAAGKSMFGFLGSDEANRKADEELNRLDQEAKHNDSVSKARQVLQKNVSKARAGTPLGQISGTGATLGMDKSQVLQAGGGGVGTAQGQGAINAGLAAQTMFGVGGGTSGAFLQGGRRGGLVGGKGKAGGMLTSALGDAMRLGLEGSEITKYMEQMANGIMQWEQTGIPVNKDSLKSIGEEVGKAGIGGPRGLAIAGGLQNYAQGLSKRGIQSGADFMMLQELGGYKGGGAEEYERALIQMEKMKGASLTGAGAGTGMGNFIKKILGTGGEGASGRLHLGKVLQGIGVDASTSEVKAIAMQALGEELSPEQQKMIQSVQSRRKAGAQRAGTLDTPGKLLAAAQGEVPGGLQKQADLRNKQINMGAKMLPIVQGLAASSANMATAFTTLAADENSVLPRAIKGLEQFTKNLESESILAALGKLFNTGE